MRVTFAVVESARAAAKKTQEPPMQNQHVGTGLSRRPLQKQEEHGLKPMLRGPRSRLGTLAASLVVVAQARELVLVCSA
jgi:hypothetical protein